MKLPIYLIVLVVAVAGVLLALFWGPKSEAAAPPDPAVDRATDGGQEFISLQITGPNGTRMVRIPRGCAIQAGHADCVDPNGTQRLISLGDPPFKIEKAFDSRGVEIPSSRPKSLEELKALGIDLSHQNDTPVDLSSIPVFRPPQPEPPRFIAEFPEVPIPGGQLSQAVDGITPPNVPVLRPVGK
jgi:hypothetical protein